MTELDAGALIRKAEAATGLADWGGEEFFEPVCGQLLAAMVDDLNGVAGLTEAGQSVAAMRISEALAARLEFIADRRRHPEIAAEHIVAPIFITGLPRSGTTFLHTLMARDPRNRTPRTYEMLFPTATPVLVGGVDPRVERARLLLERLGLLKPDVLALHPFHEIEPEEDHLVHEMMMLGETPPAMFRMPGYMRQRAEIPGDMNWKVHHQVMQSLQRASAGDRLLLKHPGHIFDIPGLLRTYPDARIIQTHRDPAKVLASVSAMVLILRQQWCEASADRAKIGRGNLKAFQAGLEALIELRADPAIDGHFVDIQFREMIADPMAAVRRIYATFAIELTEDARAAMQAWLDDPANRTPRGTHQLETYGLDQTAVHAAFDRYLDHFGIQLEAA